MIKARILSFIFNERIGDEEKVPSFDIKIKA
jgi:hypothetical protein